VHLTWGGVRHLEPFLRQVRFCCFIRGRPGPEKSMSRTSHDDKGTGEAPHTPTVRSEPLRAGPCHVPCSPSVLKTDNRAGWINCGEGLRRVHKCRTSFWSRHEKTREKASSVLSAHRDNNRGPGASPLWKPQGKPSGVSGRCAAERQGRSERRERTVIPSPWTRRRTRPTRVCGTTHPRRAGWGGSREKENNALHQTDRSCHGPCGGARARANCVVTALAHARTRASPRSAGEGGR
jgi:hypothetical protein